MAMSQGTYTFLACFGGFWLVWAMVVLLCCLCSFLQRRLKRMREERHREQCLRTVEAESLTCPAPAPPPPAPPREPTHVCGPQLCPLQAVSGAAPPLHVPHPLPQATWVTMPTEADVYGKPPCYEEAVLMEDPPPPYSEVLADPRGGTYLKPVILRPAPCPVPTHCPIPAPCHVPGPCPVPTHCPVPAHCPIPAPCPVPAPCPMPAHCPIPAHSPAPLPVPSYPSYSESKAPVSIADRGYSSLIRLPSSQRWDSLGHLLSNMDLNHSHLTPPPSVHSMRGAGAVAMTMPRRDVRAPRDVRAQAGYGSLRGRTNLGGGHRGPHRGVRGLESNCGLPTAFPLLGRSTAV